MNQKILSGCLLLIVILINTRCEKNPPESVTDIDGNIYKTVTIGDQVWLAENLRVTKLNDGNEIPSIEDNAVWVSLTTPGLCFYENNIGNKDPYGALYNWYAVSTNKLCPEGWHVPSDIEWTTLTDFLGGESLAGGKLKETGTDHWAAPNTGATNVSGFSALPGGYRGAQGLYYFQGTWGNYWTSTSPYESVAYYRLMTNVSQEVDNGKGNAVQRLIGHSVRCIMD
jgi:uncharacterized protein (TIGR02145 family)